MKIGQVAQTMNVAPVEKKNSTRDSKEVQAAAGQAQDKVEISKEALAASKGLQETPKEEVKSATKMSAEERAALVSQLKEKMEQDKAEFFSLVRNTIAGQGNALAKDDDVWQFIASGKYTVDAETKAKAQEAVSEDGHYGVKKTAERLFSFASSLAGDDPKKMKEMEAAFEEGFKEATKSWGGELPDISKKTYDAVKEKFAAFYENAAGAK